MQQDLLSSSKQRDNANVVVPIDVKGSISYKSQMEDARDGRIIPAFHEYKPNEYVVPNVIITGRYNIITFFPQNLFEQFRRLANVYFLVLGIIAAIGEFGNYYDTAVQAVGILTPVSAVVLISMIKDGIEDWKRHTTDKIVNARPAKRIDAMTGDVRAAEWKDLLPGNVVLLVNGDEVPADCVVLACGGIQGPVCYVETAAIDGETNLKPRRPCISMMHEADNGTAHVIAEGNDNNISMSRDRRKVSSSRSLDRLRSIYANVENPNEVIYSFNGSIQAAAAEGSGVTEYTLTKDNLLLRGSIIRASEWCLGLVVYTGAETKLSLNSKKPPSKLSSVDRIVNRTLLIAMSCMLLVCIISMISEIEWLQGNSGAHYLCLKKSSLNNIFTQGGGCDSGMPESILTVFTFATLYNNFVCISMYVSLEMVYLCQAYFISKDRKIYDPTTDSPAECHATGMCADLGQIQYVLSDKTGTLTKNVMKLRRISVTGRKYGAPIVLGGLIPATAAPPDSQHVPRRSSAFRKADRDRTETRKAGANGGQEFDYDLFRTSEGDIWLPLHELAVHANAARTAAEGLSESEAADEGYVAEIVNDSRLITDFLRVLVACNTVIIMPDANGKSFVNTSVELVSQMQAESPDEVALVVAAAEYGGQLLVQRKESMLLIRRIVQNPRSTTLGNSVMSNASDQSDIGIKLTSMGVEGADCPLSVDPQPFEEVLHILAVNAFDSDRKRMSVLVRVGTRTVLLCKGADSHMLPVCNQGIYRAECTKHIDTFASTGLRTLVMAQREISSELAEDWLKRYNEASKLIVGRTEQLVECAKIIERDMELLGAVGVEDELQEGVPQAISSLLSAGLNVWMITGDKAETAIAISQQCNLLSAEHSVIRVLNLTGEALRQRILDLKIYFEREATSSTDLPPGTQPFIPNQFSLSIDTDNDLEQPLRRSGQVGRHGRESHLKSALKHGTGDSRASSSKYNSTDPTRRPKLALIIDGTSLEALWVFEDLRNWFTEAVRNVPTVIACRVSPKQKASLVRLIKTGAANPITLAIGDGANDVGMIHEARVGVGITGKEGRHAANSSDFAIGQFRFLVPLMFEHGRYNYIRCCKLVLYSFFKNLLLVSVLFYYCIFSGYSGTVPLDSIIFSGYNFYLGLPIIALGAMDLDVPKEAASKHVYLAYSTGRCAELLNLKNMAIWCSLAFLQGYILFVMAIRFMSGNNTFVGNKYYIAMDGPGLNNADGQEVGLFSEGYLLYTCIVVAMNNKAIAMTTTRTWINWLLWLLSILGFFLFTYVYGVFDSIDWFNVVPLAFDCGPYWLAVILIPFVLWMFDLTIETIMSMLVPSSQQKLVSLIESEQRAAHVPQGSQAETASFKHRGTDETTSIDNLPNRRVAFRPPSEQSVINPVAAQSNNVANSSNPKTEVMAEADGSRLSNTSQASASGTTQRANKTTFRILPHSIANSGNAAPTATNLRIYSTSSLESQLTTTEQTISIGLLPGSFSDDCSIP